jgi:hypothetical protein
VDKGMRDELIEGWFERMTRKSEGREGWMGAKDHRKDKEQLTTLYTQFIFYVNKQLTTLLYYFLQSFLTLNKD